jgi:hypothetical protein
MYNDKTGAPEAARPSSPHSSVRPLARNPVHWYCSSNPMYTPTHCNVGILQCSAHHHSTSVRVWRSPTMCWGAAARSRPAAPSAPPVPPRARTSRGIRRAARTAAASSAPLAPQHAGESAEVARAAFALCPCSTPPATAMSSKRGATAMPAVLPLRNHAQASATLTRGIRVILTARRGGADSTQGLRLAQVRAQHQSGC